ncbi:MAG: DUF5652 family protein [Candidatus Pacearchaeota archaeon]|jgi:hypothetical protein
MVNDYLAIASAALGVPIWVLVLIVIWSGVWKLLALWKSARKGSIPWFIVLGILNTLGILEILYIFVFSKMKIKNIFKKKGKKED